MKAGDQVVVTETLTTGAGRDYLTRGDVGVIEADFTYNGTTTGYLVRFPFGARYAYATCKKCGKFKTIRL